MNIINYIVWPVRDRYLVCTIVRYIDPDCLWGQIARPLTKNKIFGLSAITWT